MENLDNSTNPYLGGTPLNEPAANDWGGVAKNSLDVDSAFSGYSIPIPTPSVVPTKRRFIGDVEKSALQQVAEVHAQDSWVDDAPDANFTIKAILIGLLPLGLTIYILALNSVR